jgi:lysyl-tRNA synthetase class 2
MGIGMDRLCMMLTNNSSIQDVLFFPQMRPEKVERKVELEGNENVIYGILSKEGIMNLAALKEQSGLSNKQWDKGIKALTKARLIKVTKSDDGLTVEAL